MHENSNKYSDNNSGSSFLLLRDKIDVLNNKNIFARLKKEKKREHYREAKGAGQIKNN